MAAITSSAVMFCRTVDGLYPIKAAMAATLALAASRFAVRECLSTWIEQSVAWRTSAGCVRPRRAALAVGKQRIAPSVGQFPDHGLRIELFSAATSSGADPETEAGIAVCLDHVKGFPLLIHIAVINTKKSRHLAMLSTVMLKSKSEDQLDVKRDVVRSLVGKADESIMCDDIGIGTDCS